MSSPARDIQTGLSEPVSGHEGALEIRLRKRYSSGQLRDFKLEIELAAAPGVTVILGHSGAGKTTLLRCVAGLSDPEEGRIAIAGRVLFDSMGKVRVEPSRRRVAYVFQDLALFPHLTVKGNVMYGLRRLARAERERRALEMLKSFHIDHLCNRLPREISGGEQQRVALARSLVTEPAALLLDEPLSSLDARTKESIIADLRRWNQARDIPILYVTHDHGELLALGDRVVTLDQGRIVAMGLPPKAAAASNSASEAEPENMFNAIVVDHRKEEGVTVFQLSGTSVRIEAPMAELPVGALARIGIRAIASEALRRVFVFICSGNTSRSPMAQAICNAEIARRLKVPLELLDQFGIHAVSAGLSAETGAPLTSEAQDALREAGLPPLQHAARNLDAELASRAEVIFCMTQAQRDTIVSRFPDAADKVLCLDAERDIDDPSGKGAPAFLNLVFLLQNLVAARLDVLGIPDPA